jgi:hypothetical protein
LYAFLISSMRATCPYYTTLLDLVKRTGSEVLHLAVSSSLLPLPS